MLWTGLNQLPAALGVCSGESRQEEKKTFSHRDPRNLVIQRTAKLVFSSGWQRICSGLGQHPQRNAIWCLSSKRYGETGNRFCRQQEPFSSVASAFSTSLDPRVGATCIYKGFEGLYSGGCYWIKPQVIICGASERFCRDICYIFRVRSIFHCLIGWLASVNHADLGLQLFYMSNLKEKCFLEFAFICSLNSIFKQSVSGWMDYSMGFGDGLTDWLIDRLVDWLIDWLKPDRVSFDFKFYPALFLPPHR